MAEGVYSVQCSATSYYKVSPFGNLGRDFFFGKIIPELGESADNDRGEIHFPSTPLHSCDRNSTGNIKRDFFSCRTQRDNFPNS